MTVENSKSALDHLSEDQKNKIISKYCEKGLSIEEILIATIPLAVKFAESPEINVLKNGAALIDQRLRKAVGDKRHTERERMGRNGTLAKEKQQTPFTLPPSGSIFNRIKSALPFRR